MKPEKPKQTFQSILLREMEHSRLRNPAYSLRAFARKLGLQPSALSELIKGKRGASPLLIQKILKKVGVDPEEIQGALELLPRRKNSASVLAYTQLQVDEYRLISEWHHFAILSLSETEGYVHDAYWIAGRLGITQKDAASALQRLEQLGVLKVEPGGGGIRKPPNFTTTDEVANLSLRKSHAQNLELAQRSLENAPIEQRDFTAITMAIDPAKISEAKKMIREFRDRLCAHLEAERRTEVYKLCVQLIPLSRNPQTPSQEIL